MTRQRTTASSSSPLAAHAALPVGARPLVWGEWAQGSPHFAANTRLIISGYPGVWALHAGVEYGRNRAVELVRWQERGQLWAASATRVIAPVEWVYVVSAVEGEAR